MDLFARAVDAVLRDAGVERTVLVGIALAHLSSDSSIASIRRRLWRSSLSMAPFVHSATRR